MALSLDRLGPRQNGRCALEVVSLGDRIAMGPRSVSFCSLVYRDIKFLNPGEERSLGVGDRAGIDGIRVGRGREDFTLSQSGGFEVFPSRNL